VNVTVTNVEAGSQAHIVITPDEGPAVAVTVTWDGDVVVTRGGESVYNEVDPAPAGG
jgi:hypothetical protein